LIKRLLQNDKIITETSEDIRRKLENHLNVKFLLISKDPLKQLENIDEFWRLLKL